MITPDRILGLAKDTGGTTRCYLEVSLVENLIG